MKTKVANAEGREYGGMSGRFNIIRGARNCDYEEVDGALQEDPKCINSQDEFGLTAAHISVMRHNFGLLSKLVEQPLYDPFVMDNSDRRAIDCASHPGMHEIKRLLLNKMYL